MYRNQYLIENAREGEYMTTGPEARYFERRKLDEKFDNFASSLKSFLVSESIDFILNKVIYDKSQELKRAGRSLCESFVEEIGTSTLIRRFERESCMLAEMALVVNETYDNIMCKVDKNDELTFTIKPSDRKDFYDKLDDVDVTHVVDKIRQRCCDATTEYIQNNVNDKLDFEEIAADAQEKINKIKEKSQEKRDAMVKEYTLMAKGRADIIRCRRKNIYESMVNILTSKAIKNPTEYSQFVAESGSVDYDRVVDVADVMYGFLETVNTARIYNVDNRYIKTVLESIA